MASYLRKLVEQKVLVVTCDGKVIVGTLRGCDQVTNLILEDAVERSFSEKAGVETVDLGLYIVRGPNVAVIGELDAAKEEELKLSELRGAPVGVVVHGMN